MNATLGHTAATNLFPNVVYSCGSFIHNNELVIPYAMADFMSGIATVGVKELINAMQPMV